TRTWTARSSTPIRAMRAASICLTSPITTSTSSPRGATRIACRSTPTGCAGATSIPSDEDAMTYKQSSEQIGQYRAQIADLRKKMREAQAAIEPEEVKDYTFARANGGAVRLSELFGDKDTLIVIHNMGMGCTSCTLWADGFNGVYEHLASRA